MIRRLSNAIIDELGPVDGGERAQSAFLQSLEFSSTICCPSG
jgi:hypothetical protein